MSFGAIALLLWVLLDALRGAFIKLLPATVPRANSLATIAAISSVLSVHALLYFILAGQFADLHLAIPAYQEKFSVLLQKFADLVKLDEIPTTKYLLEQIDMTGLVSWLGVSAGSFFTDVMLILIYLGFLLAEQNMVAQKLSRLTHKPEQAQRYRQVAYNMMHSVQRYIWMKTRF